MTYFNILNIIGIQNIYYYQQLHRHILGRLNLPVLAWPLLQLKIQWNRGRIKWLQTMLSTITVRWCVIRGHTKSLFPQPLSKKGLMCAEPLDFRQGVLSVTVVGEPVSAPLHQHGEWQHQATANVSFANAIIANVLCSYMHSQSIIKRCRSPCISIVIVIISMCVCAVRLS